MPRRALRRHADVLGVIALGGVLGAEVRYGIGRLLPHDGGVPWGTLVVNALGSLLIGVLMIVIFELTAPHRLVRPFLGIGLLGGFTTFSAYAVETLQLLEDGRAQLALAYMAATPVLAIAFAWAGAAAARTVISRRRGGHP